MSFRRPLDQKYPICANFLAWGERFEWYIDKDNGYWIPRGSEPGAKGQHRGTDFACPVGTPVMAMADGMITKTGFERAIYTELGCGLHILQLVSLPGYDSWWIRYGHLRRVLVHLGDTVKAGQVVAESGQSGAAGYPMLHVDLMDTKHQYKEIPWTR